MTTDDRRQLNISLPAELIRELKYRAVDEDTTLAKLVETLLRGALGAEPRPTTDHRATLAPLPIVYLDDMVRGQAFFHALGMRTTVAARSGSWLELSGGGLVALHRATDAPKREHGEVELAFATAAPLEEVEASLQGTPAGDRCEPITDISIGRSMTVADDDGFSVSILEREPGVYA